MVTMQMAEQLRALGYKDDHIKSMLPKHAMAILDKAGSGGG